MPNRDIKESARTSPTLAQLSHGAERLFWRLTTFCDDYGRFDASPIVVRTACLPLVPRVTDKDVRAWLNEFGRANLARFYCAGDRVFGYLVSWSRHQRIRNKMSKFPDPTESLAEVPNPPSIAVNCRQLPQSAASPVVPGTTVVPATTDKRDTVGAASPDLAIELLEFLNRKTGRSYRPVETNLALIRARLADGMDPYRLKAMISRKTRAWSSDPTMAPYLRPVTLFNRTKCEQYLGELPLPQPEDINGHLDGMP